MVPIKVFITSSTFEHSSVTLLVWITSPSASPVAVTIPNLPVARYFLEPYKKYEENLAACPKQIGKSPEANGSKDPVWPPLLAL